MCSLNWGGIVVSSNRQWFYPLVIRLGHIRRVSPVSLRFSVLGQWWRCGWAARGVLERKGSSLIPLVQNSITKRFTRPWDKWRTESTHPGSWTLISFEAQSGCQARWKLIRALKELRHGLLKLKSLASIFQIRRLQSVLIFSILFHPCSFMSYHYLFCVFLSY